MKKFDIDKLPNDVKEKIDFIEWQDGTLNEDLAGIVYLKDGWCSFDDCSHVIGFENRIDLIEILTTQVVKENISENE